jgi:hypothetical protein
MSARRYFLINLAKEMDNPEIRRELKNPQKGMTTIRKAAIACGFLNVFWQEWWKIQKGKQQSD